ncbi:monovalent cation/H(+) antiporter subunit G [Halalkalibacter urbisdiaboli]|uniref:monovalent cation/H(+) antiporter subunit G n=1 Tax=Halalkalibacter urbisdiaboli TaxID=1960589 RepID=UPI000B43DD5D|nr:monovalent cation/H(+) antiporter subunit G [Halalkalibacter urbisdiaboli]
MTETEISSIFVSIFVLLGSLLSLVTTIGLLRLPDVYSRTHAASKSATLGVLLVLLGALLFFYKDSGLDARLILGIVFVFITSPVAGHLISRAAYYTNVPLWDKSVRDDLKNVSKEKRNRSAER